MGRRKSSRKSKSASARSAQSAAPATGVTSPQHQEDAALWAQVTKSLTPLKGAKDRLHFGPLLDEKPSNSRSIANHATAQDPRSSIDRAKGDQSASPGRVTARGTLKGRQAGQTAIERPQTSALSRRELRQINKGHRSIEARLDLHGMRQAGAHIALRGFLADARARGYRHVLVITGKGRSGNFNEMGGGGMMFGEQEPGILRRMVPLWLGEPDLREIVAGFSAAPRRHGGEGALYVRLRRNRS